jgi:hypothetical protein
MFDFGSEVPLAAGHRMERRRIPASQRVALQLATLTIAMSACSSGTDIYFAFVSADGTTVTIGVAACNADHKVDVDERVDQVVVKVTATNGSEGDCADAVQFRLSEPLGDRSLIDASDGEEIEIRDGG